MKLTPGSSWSMFAKNGNDVTTLALTVARAQTGKKTVLVQPQGYHGAGPVWTKERLKFYLDPTMFDSRLSTFSFDKTNAWLITYFGNFVFWVFCHFSCVIFCTIFSVCKAR